MKQPTNVEELKEAPGLIVRNSPAFKLKDRDRRNFVPIDLKKEFNFIPKLIVIEKVHGRNNTFFVRAVLTEEEKKKQDKATKKKLKEFDKKKANLKKLEK